MPYMASCSACGAFNTLLNSVQYDWNCGNCRARNEGREIELISEEGLAMVRHNRITVVPANSLPPPIPPPEGFIEATIPPPEPYAPDEKGIPARRVAVPSASDEVVFNSSGTTTLTGTLSAGAGSHTVNGPAEVVKKPVHKRVKLKLHRLRGSEDLDDDWKSFCKDTSIKVVLYDYHSEDYGGNGEALVLTEDGWYRVNISHNSCDGPLDSIGDYIGDPTFGSPRLDALKAKNSPELNGDLEKLYKLAEKNGYSEEREPEPYVVKKVRIFVPSKEA